MTGVQTCALPIYSGSQLKEGAVPSRVRIKAGPVEFEYDGEMTWSIDNIKDMFSHIETLFKVPVLSEIDHASTGSKPDSAKKDSNEKKQKLHVTSVATKLKAKTGPELAVAAAATLQIYDGKQSFSRVELSDTMKSATMHYKISMLGNLTKIIGSLIGKEFNQISEGVYSLTAAEYDRLANELA